MSRKKRKRWALISVYYKTGVVELARRLIRLGFSILASGGTARTLQEAGIKVTDVAELVGGEAILGHRVVTLSREVHAGLLAQWIDEDIIQMELLGLPYIDLVVSNLYPMIEVIAQEDATEELVIEKTDIGGPCLLRSAAKGRRIIITDPSQYDQILSWLEAGEQDRENVIRKMAANSEYIATRYSLASTDYISAGEMTGIVGRQKAVCRYGENAPQAPAALYSVEGKDPLAIDRFRLVFGAPPSFNNFCDVDRLLQTMTHAVAAFDLNRGRIPFVAIGAKHGNPCGAAFSRKPDEAITKMAEGDKRALFGGLVMTNFVLNSRLAELLLTHGMGGGRQLLDGVVVPGITEDAMRMFGRKGDKCRVLVNEELGALNAGSLDPAPRIRYVRGGFLRQPNYDYVLRFDDPELVLTSLHEDPYNIGHEDALLLAWAIAATSNSNTITLVQLFEGGAMLIGNGVGQQDRVTAAEFAVRRARNAKHPTLGAVAVSDSFFPDPDGAKVLAKAGVSVIFASSGSIKDNDVRAACQEAGITFYQLPDPKCRGFFGH